MPFLPLMSLQVQCGGLCVCVCGGGGGGGDEEVEKKKRRRLDPFSLPSPQLCRLRSDGRRKAQ